MLHFIKELDIYDPKDITRAELNLLQDTNMIDFAADKCTELGDEIPESLMQKREQIVEQLQN